MNNPKDIQFVGKHDYDKPAAIAMAEHFRYNFKTFSVGIFKWELKNNGKSMKKGKILVRVKAGVNNQKKAFEHADEIILKLDVGEYSGGKTVTVK